MLIVTRRRARACGALAFFTFCGCGRHAPDPAPVAPEEGPRIGWMHPADGDSLADTIRAEVSVEGPSPARIVLAVNGERVGERTRPPWRFLWSPEAVRPQELTLLAAAFSAAEETARSPAIEIRWFPNQPPIVRFLAPRDARAIERSAADSLIAEALDPEEGRLAGSALVWISSVQGYLGCGDRIPLDALVLGPHRLRARATDGWGRSGWAEREMEVFEYRGGTTPEGALDDMRHALGAEEPGVYEESLAPDFRFVFCLSDRFGDPEAPSRWCREDESAFVRTVLLGTGIGVVAVGWDVASVQPATIGERKWVKAELTGIDLALTIGATDTLSVVNGAARVYLSYADRWRVEQWRDVGAEAGVTQGRLRLMACDPLNERYLGR